MHLSYKTLSRNRAATSSQIFQHFIVLAFSQAKMYQLFSDFSILSIRICCFYRELNICVIEFEDVTLDSGLWTVNLLVADLIWIYFWNILAFNTENTQPTLTVLEDHSEL